MLLILKKLLWKITNLDGIVNTQSNMLLICGAIIFSVANGDEEIDTAVENEATRGKLERLRMVMEQNKARRRARREGKSPWSASEPTAVSYSFSFLSLKYNGQYITNGDVFFFRTWRFQMIWKALNPQM